MVKSLINLDSWYLQSMLHLVIEISEEEYVIKKNRKLNILEGNVLGNALVANRTPKKVVVYLTELLDNLVQLTYLKHDQSQ